MAGWSEKQRESSAATTAKRIARHDARVLRIISRLRDEGLGFGKIALELNKRSDRMSCSGWKSWQANREHEYQEYEPAKTWAGPGGGEWSKMAVSRICKRHGL